MTLITRMTRLFRADVHGMLDWLEEPEAVLKQAVRDMETEIATGEQALAELGRREENLKAFVDHLRHTIAELDGQIDICFEEGNDDLVRPCIRKKLEAENRLKAVTRTAAAVTADKTAQQQKISDQKAQLSTIVAKMSLFMESCTRSSGQDPVASFETGMTAVSDDEVEIAFLHEKRTRAGSGGQGK